MKSSVAVKTLIAMTSVVALFHVGVLVKAIPAYIVWGGGLKSEVEFYVLESVSLLVNAFLIWLLLQKGRFIKARMGEKSVSRTLWVFLVLFALNTIGNLFAETFFEKALAGVTLVNALLVWRINMSPQG